MRTGLQPLPHSDDLMSHSEWGAREPAGQGTRLSPHQQGEDMTQQQESQPSALDGFDRQTNRMRNHLWVWIALGFVVAGVLAVGTWGLGSSTSATHTVVYTASADSVTGSGRSGMLTLQTENGGTSQAVVDLPFSGPSTSFHPGDFLYISVQNQQGSGSVTCRITVDGVVVSENTSTGGYTIATCQGRMP